MGRTASSGQDEWAAARKARVDRARARRVALDADHAARDQRIDAVLADVYHAQDAKTAAANAAADADRRIGHAIESLLGERVTTAQTAADRPDRQRRPTTSS